MPAVQETLAQGDPGHVEHHSELAKRINRQEFPSGNGRTLYAYGHSLLGADTYTTRYIARLSTRFGATLVNGATGGQTMQHVATRLVGTGSYIWTPSNAPGRVVVIDAVGNNALQSRATERSVRSFGQSFEAAVRVINSGVISQSVASTWTYTGTWTTNNGQFFGGGNNRVSTDPNAAYSFTMGGAADVTIQTLVMDERDPLWAIYGSHPAFDILVNGNVVRSVTVDEQRAQAVAGGYAALSYHPFTVNIGLRYAGDVITVRRTTPSTNPEPLMGSDAALYATSALPLVVAVKSVLLPAAGYAAATATNGPITDFDIHTYNNELTRVAARFPNVVVVDPQAAGFDSPTMHGVDGVHLTNAGADFYAKVVGAAIAKNAWRVGWGIPDL